MLGIVNIFQKSKKEPIQDQPNWVNDLNASSTEQEKNQWSMFQEGQLMLDIYERPDAVVVRSLIAGVNPDNLEISLHNDLLTIRGVREDVEEVCDDQFYTRECYWGSFRRTIIIPVPVAAEGIRASFKNGVVTIELPKLSENPAINLVYDDELLED